VTYKWIRRKNESNFVPKTAVAALEACDQTTFPLNHTFLSILVTLPASRPTASASQDLAKVSSYRRQADELALMNVHRAIAC